MSPTKAPPDPTACSFPASDEELRKLLSPEQYYVVKQNGTEAPFNNAYWNNKQAGIYVDIISGEALFSSKDKFDSGTGWPSFTAPIHKSTVLSKADSSHGMQRNEVRSSKSDAHLGHVFDDGPAPTGLRYCINSAALRFIPVKEMAAKGYGDLLYLFQDNDSLVKDIPKKETATFAAGCFWGVEEKFRKIPGVLNTTVGYTGGNTTNPTYKEVCTDTTGHAEAVQIEFDPSRVTYSELLEAFFKMHNPTALNRQGPDIGSQYRSAVFFHSAEQEESAKVIRKKLQESRHFREPIVTEIVQAGEFYKAEEYHQQYLQKASQNM